MSLFTVVQNLKEEEKFTPHPVPDSKGTVIGYGHNLQTLGLTEEWSAVLLDEVVWYLWGELDKLSWFRKLNDARQGCVVEMAYQMGVPGVLTFKNTIAAIVRGDYNGAADRMLKSKWATKDSPARAKRVIERFRRG